MGDELGEAVRAPSRRERLLAEHGGVETVSTRAETDRDSTAGDVIQRHQILGERDRMTEVRRRHERSESDVARDGGGLRERLVQKERERLQRQQGPGGTP